MSTETIIFLILGAAAGGFINGLAGTGTALFALGFLLVVLDPITAVGIVALISVLSGFQGLWLVRAEIWKRPRRLLRFLMPGLLGVPLGIYFLDMVDPGVLRITIAILLMIYGGYFGFRAALPAFSRPTPKLDAAVGFVGGILGGAAMSGAIPTLWLSLRPWTKTATRAVLQPYNFVLLTTTVVLLGFRGVYDAGFFKAFIIAMPIGLIAAQIGIWVFGRLSDTGFRRLLILLTLVMGAGILISELL